MVYGVSAVSRLSASASYDAAAGMYHKVQMQPHGRSLGSFARVIPLPHTQAHLKICVIPVLWPAVDETWCDTWWIHSVVVKLAPCLLLIAIIWPALS